MELDRGVGAKGGKWEGAIDQRFARGIGPDRDDATIVQTVISLGHGLSIRMIAIGVETLEQLLFLHQHERDEIQGYYFSRPIPAAEFIVAPGK